jgi:hypothetical protein
MVSPAYKQGNPISPEAIAEDGSRIVAMSWGAFGAVGPPQLRNSAGTAYEFARGPAGWRVTPLAPADPRFAGASTWRTTSADVTDTLWSMPTAPVGEDDFYVRGADGRFADVGPATPPADGPTVEPAPEGSGPRLSFFPFEGASGDLSHVVFRVFSVEKGLFLWPGDGTAEGRSNLYEYAGTANTAPKMVGVSGGPGSTSLIGECGVLLGGERSKYNAISEDGATVFFTPVGEQFERCNKPQPAVDELFARLDQSRSVLLSGPSPAACTTPECKNAPPADALFEGASRDGSKAVFASTQQLTDEASEDPVSGDSSVSPGCSEAHGSGCNLYEYDFSNLSGKNLVLLSAGSTAPRVQGVVRISQDGSHVYFVAQGVLTGRPNSQGQTAQQGADNLYVYERGEPFGKGTLQFIGTLASSDEEVWGAQDTGRPAEATPDGRFLVFQSHADLTPDDTSSGVWQIFEYDAQTERLARVSIGQHGFNNNGNSALDSATIHAPGYGGGGRGGDMPQPLALSNDGSYVVFQTAAGLTPLALDNVTIDPQGAKANNVYEYHNGEVLLISDGQDVSAAGQGSGSNVTVIGTSASGRDIFFTTGDQLTSEDVDTQQDLYDARVGGGFASQPEPATCRGEACLGALSPRPPVAGANSVTQGAGENLAARVPNRQLVTITKRTRSGTHVLLTVNLELEGSVTITGHGLRRYQKTLGAGPHVITLALLKAGHVARGQHKRVVLKVVLTSGATVSSATTTLRL